MNNLAPLLTFALASFFFANSTAFSEKSHGDHSSSKKRPIEQNLKAHRYSSIHFSGQPTDADIEQLKGQGFAAVINLRLAKEGPINTIRKRKQSRAQDWPMSIFPQTRVFPSPTPGSIR